MNYELARKTRRYLDLTQEQVGAMVGVGGATVARWESGDREPKASHLGRWAAALGLAVDELLSEPVTPKGAA